jgi:hypothetical protein
VQRGFSWGDSPMGYNVGKMKRVFGLEFSGEEEIRKHVKWNLEMKKQITKESIK